MEKLEEAIKNRPKHLSPDYHADCRRIFQKVEESFRKIEAEFDAFKKQLQDHLEAMPEALDKKYEYKDVNGLKQIRLYEFLPNLRTWKAKLKKLLGKEKP